MVHPFRHSAHIRAQSLSQLPRLLYFSRPTPTDDRWSFQSKAPLHDQGKRGTTQQGQEASSLTAFVGLEYFAKAGTLCTQKGWPDCIGTLLCPECPSQA